MPKAPVEFFAFNRPEYTRRSFFNPLQIAVSLLQKEIADQNDLLTLFRKSINLQIKNLQLRNQYWGKKKKYLSQHLASMWLTSQMNKLKAFIEKN